MNVIVRMTLPIIVAALFVVAATNVSAQSPQEQPSPVGAADLIPDLHLTPDQLQRIRQIQRETKDERAAIGQRLRESNRALEDALDAETLDESLIEQRMQAVATAQSAQMRMRIQTEVRIRRVLNPEQLAIWRELRLKAGDVRRRPQINRPLRPGINGLRPNQRNGVAPLNQRRNDPMRTPRP